MNSEAGGRCDKSRVWDEVLVLAYMAVQIIYEPGSVRMSQDGSGVVAQR